MGKNIALWGFGKVADEAAKRILSAKRIGSQQIDRVTGFTSPKISGYNVIPLEDRIRDVRGEYLSVPGMHDVERFDLCYREDAVLDGYDMVFVTGDLNKDRRLPRVLLAKENLIMMKELAGYIPSNFQGIVGIVSNLPEILCQASDLGLTESQVFGVTDVDRIRLYDQFKESVSSSRTLAYPVGVHGDVTIFFKKPRVSGDFVDQYEDCVNRIGPSTMKSYGITKEKTAEAMTNTMAAAFNHRTVISAAVAYDVENVGRMYVTLPARFDDHGIWPDHGIIDIFDNRTRQMLEQSAGRLADDLSSFGDIGIEYRRQRKRWRVPGFVKAAVITGAVILGGCYVAGLIDWSNRQDKKAESMLETMQQQIDDGDYLRARITGAEIIGLKCDPDYKEEVRDAIEGMPSP